MLDCISGHFKTVNLSRNTNIINQMKYKYNVNYEFLQYLSKRVHFDILKYL